MVAAWKVALPSWASKVVCDIQLIYRGQDTEMGIFKQNVRVVRYSVGSAKLDVRCR